MFFSHNYIFLLQCIFFIFFVRCNRNSDSNKRIQSTKIDLITYWLKLDSNKWSSGKQSLFWTGQNKIFSSQGSVCTLPLPFNLILRPNNNSLTIINLDHTQKKFSYNCYVRFLVIILFPLHLLKRKRLKHKNSTILLTLRGSLFINSWTRKNIHLKKNEITTCGKCSNSKLPTVQAANTVQGENTWRVISRS